MSTTSAVQQSGLGNYSMGGGVMGGISNIMGGIAGLGNMYLSYRQVKEAEKQNKFNAATYNRNLENQGKLINNSIDASSNVAAAMSYDKGSGTTFSDFRDKYMSNAKDRHVNTTAVSYQ